MKPSLQCDSGFVGSADLIASDSPEMRILRIIRVSDMSVTAMGERYGHRWFIKSIPDVDTSTVALQRLKKEFEIQSKLHHPGIATAVSLEKINGIGLCIIAEWIEGKTLAEVLDEGKLARNDRLRLTNEIIEALAYLHSEGIVHRDIKPENIMIRKNGGSAVIVDFGLADTDTHTQLKAAAGTEGYMAPEAYSRHEADTRDDVYSIGVVLTQLSCGYKTIIRRCLSAPKNRYENAGRLKEALNRIEKNSRYIRRASIALCLIVILGVMIMEIIALRNENIGSVERMAMMQDSVGVLVKNANANLRTISNMTDTISKLKGNITELSTELNKQRELDNIVEKCLDHSRAVYRQYDEKRINQLLANGYKPFDIDNEAHAKSREYMNKYIDGLSNKLPEETLVKIKYEIIDGEIKIYHDWATKHIFNRVFN